MRVAAVLIVHVARDVEARIAADGLREVEGKRLREPIRELARKRRTGLFDHPDKEDGLHDEHGGQAGHEADRDFPVKALIPAGRHGVGFHLLP